MLLNVREGGPIGVTTEGETYFQHETVVSWVGHQLLKEGYVLGCKTLSLGSQFPETKYLMINTWPLLGRAHPKVWSQN